MSIGGRRRYRVTLAILGLAALLFYAASFRFFSSQTEAWRSLLQALGDGAAVSLVVAAAVEPYLRNRFLHEMHHDIMWGLLNADASDAHKEAVQHLAQLKHIFKNAQWRVNFEWEDRTARILAVTIEARNDGVSYETGGYEPTGELWILGSTEGYKSRYLEWTMTVSSSPGWSKDNTYNEKQLIDHRFAIEDEGGRVVVDEGKMANSRKVTKGEHYTITRKAVMYRHEVGYVPLAYSRPTLAGQIVLGGAALDDLEVTMLHPSERGLFAPVQERRVGESGEPLVFPHVVMPGQMSLVTWRLRRDRLFDPDTTVRGDRIDVDA